MSYGQTFCLSSRSKRASLVLLSLPPWATPLSSFSSLIHDLTFSFLQGILQLHFQFQKVRTSRWALLQTWTDRSHLRSITANSLAAIGPLQVPVDTSIHRCRSISAYIRTHGGYWPCAPIGRGSACPPRADVQRRLFCSTVRSRGIRHSLPRGPRRRRRGDGISGSWTSVTAAAAGPGKARHWPAGRRRR